MSFCRELTEDQEKPTAARAKNAHKEGFVSVILASSGQTRVSQRLALKWREFFEHLGIRPLDPLLSGLHLVCRVTQ